MVDAFLSPPHPHEPSLEVDLFIMYSNLIIFFQIPRMTRDKSPFEISVCQHKKCRELRRNKTPSSPKRVLRRKQEQVKVAQNFVQWK